MPDAAPPPETVEFSIQALIVEVDREIAKRRNVYAGLIASGKMHQGTGERQLAMMKAIRKVVANAAIRSRSNRDGPDKRVSAEIEKIGRRMR